MKISIHHCLIGVLISTGCGVPANGTKVAEVPSVPVGANNIELVSIAGQRIVNYNVENLFDTKADPSINDQDFTPKGKLNWTNERYETKLKHLAEAISWTGSELPILISLEEVENREVVEDLARTLSLKGYTVVHHDSPDERGIDVALLVRDGYAQVLSEEALSVTIPDDRTRDVLYVELGLAKGEVLHVFVNHWPSRHGGQEISEPKRMAAAYAVRQKVDDILADDANAQIVIMGDLNDSPMDRSVKEGLGAVCDRSATADLFDLMCIDTPQGHGSYNYQGTWSYLDQMIVSRAFLPKVKVAKALWDERLLFDHPRYGKSPDRTYAGDSYKAGYSDHLPVVMELN
ncbi:MAG: hypothetical protein KA408_10860 [Flavobacteriales bacterium]|nr:hypothetical protein [Flavobacteriales bacterium]